MDNLKDLTLTTISGIGVGAASWAADYAIAQGTNAILNKLYGNSSNLKFYYDYYAGGSFLQVLAQGVVGGAIGGLAGMAVNAFNGLINGKKPKEDLSSGKSEEWTRRIDNAYEIDRKKYGRMVLEEGGTVFALDEWGYEAPEALMLGVKTENQIHIRQKLAIYGDKNESKINDIRTNTLVWYDTTALVNISSDKNVITTKVQGRDYSRKELVSNGDIKFSVSGQISSGIPDVYPTEEVEKFFKVMQHKGIVKVNCQVLNVLGVEQILITDFNLSSKEGSKSVQSYSFSGLGLQPAKEIEIKEDTLEVSLQLNVSSNNEEESSWISMVEGKLKAASTDIFSRSVSIAAEKLGGLL